MFIAGDPFEARWHGRSVIPTVSTKGQHLLLRAQQPWHFSQGFAILTFLFSES